MLNLDLAVRGVELYAQLVGGFQAVASLDSIMMCPHSIVVPRHAAIMKPALARCMMWWLGATKCAEAFGCGRVGTEDFCNGCSIWHLFV